MVVLNPLLSTLYSALMFINICITHSLDSMFYADDTQIYIVTDDPRHSFNAVGTLLNLHRWCFCVNPNNREFATSTRRRLQTQTIVNAYFYLRPHKNDHRLRSVFKFIHFGVRFRIYAFTVSVFIVFVWTEGLNWTHKKVCVYNNTINIGKLWLFYDYYFFLAPFIVDRARCN